MSSCTSIPTHLFLTTVVPDEENRPTAVLYSEGCQLKLQLFSGPCGGKDGEGCLQSLQQPSWSLC